jgi:hypothetical protein
MIQTKFGSNWSSSFRAYSTEYSTEEKIFEKVYDVRRTPSDSNISHGTFGPGELKMFVIHEIEANDGGSWTKNLTMKLASQYSIVGIKRVRLLREFVHVNSDFLFLL